LSRWFRAFGILACALACTATPARAQASVGTLEVAWDANLTDPDLVGYRVYVDDDPATFTLAPPAAKPLAFKTIDVGKNVTNQVVSSLDSSKVWFFGVTSLDASGNESGFSNIVSAQPSVTPTIRSVSVGASQVTQGATGVVVTITGTNFVGTSTVSFGAGIIVTNLNSGGIPTMLVATISVDAIAQAKKYDVTVTNPGNTSASKSGVLTVSVRERRADIDGSGRIDGADFLRILLGFPSMQGDAHYNTNIDMDVDGKVDGADLAIFFSFFGMVGPFP